MMKSPLLQNDILSRNRYLPIHLAVFVFLYMILGFLGILHQVPNNGNLLVWDAGWYNSIRLNGYSFDPHSQSNTGFFPFFPYFWKVLGVNVLAISLINTVIAFLAFGLLANAFRFRTAESLLYLSLPVMFFLFVPYTEALFYLFTTMLLIGLYKKNNLLILAGLFFSSLVRPTSFFFLPAIFFMEIIGAGSGMNSWMKAVKNSVIYCIVTLAAFFLVILVQWYQTGIWFTYFKAQVLFWSHSFHWPRFPLTTWDGPRLLWLDGLAFWFCLLAGLWCAWLLFRTLFRRKSETSETPSKSVTFSAIFLVMTALFVLFFNPYDGRGGTSLLSLNRYVFATPFLAVILWHYQRVPELKVKVLVLLIAITIVLWLFFKSYSYLPELTAYKLPSLKTFSYFMMMTLYATGFILLNREKTRKELWIGLYFLNMLLQLFLFNAFLSAQWVG